MSEYESVQQNMGDAMASQPLSGPHFGTDPRVLAQMPDLNASEPEVTNTPSRRRRRSPDSMRSGPSASPKVIAFAVVAVVAAVLAVIVVLNRPDGSGEEQASGDSLWDNHESEAPDFAAGESSLDSEMADQGNQFAPIDDPYAPAGQYAATDQYAPVGQYPPTDEYSPAPMDQYTATDQYAPASMDQYTATDQYGPVPTDQYTATDQYAPAPTDQYTATDQYAPVGQYPPTAQYANTNTYASVDQRQPPSQYTGGSRTGSIYRKPSEATNSWDYQQPAGSSDRGPAAEAAATGGYYGDSYQTTRPSASYQDSTTYGAANQRPQANPYTQQQSVPDMRSHSPGPAVTFTPPTGSLRDQRPSYATERSTSGTYPEVAQRPIYSSDTRPSSVGSPYRNEASLPSNYQRPTTGQSSYEHSYRESIPSTSGYRGTSTSAPRYGETPTSQYSTQPGVATTDGATTRDSYDSYRSSRY